MSSRPFSLEAVLMRKKAINFARLFFLAVVASATAHAALPFWMQQAAQLPAKTYANDVNSVVLYHEVETTVRDSGETVTQHRMVIKVLRPAGRDEAYHPVYFDDETKLNYFKGWSLSAKGVEYEAKKDDVYEVSASDDTDLYTDEKAKVMRIPGVDVGTVIGVEWEQKRHPYTFEDQWIFQVHQPVDHAKFILHLPAGWEYRAAWLHYKDQHPQVQNGTYTWDLTDIPRIESEYEMPHWRALAGQMIVTFFSEKTKGRDYANWNDYGQWYTQLTSGRRDPSPALQQKVQELAPASMPMLDRLRALARFAQHDVRYAAIEVGIRGFHPPPAGEGLS